MSIREFILLFLRCKNSDPRFSFVRLDVALAQSILETGYFSSRIFVRQYNLFGMKLARKRFNTAIGEERGHAKYTSYKDSMLDYMLRMVEFKRHFEPVKNNLTEYLLGLTTSKYATDPKYTHKVSALIDKHQPQIQTILNSIGSNSNNTNSPNKKPDFAKIMSIVIALIAAIYLIKKFF